MRRTLLPLALAMALVGGFASARAETAPARGASIFDGHELFDVRADAPSLAPTEVQTQALVALVREYPDVRFEWNHRFGTASSILRYGESLTPPSSGHPVDVGRGWLRTHSVLFGWSGDDVDALRGVRTLVQPDGGPVVVLFHQVFGGLEGGSLGGSTVVTLDRENRVLSVRANVVPGTAIAEGARLTAADALTIASGERIAVPEALGTRGIGWTEFAPGPGFPARHYARPVAFPVGGGPARPSFEVVFVERLDSGWRTVVDAVTGEILYRSQMVKRQEGIPPCRVFPNYPDARRGGRHILASCAGDPEASPEGWVLVPEAPTTIGNNASTATSWTPIATTAPDGPGQVRPIGSLDLPFTDAWSNSECGQNPAPTQVGAPQAPTYAEDTLPAVVNLFYHHNVMHDFWYRLGFTEEAGAMQLQNFGKTGPELENDPLLGMAQAAAVGGDLPADHPVGRNNAYMFANDDGLPNWTGMFLWQKVPPAPPSGFGHLGPCADGDFDASLIYHEYTHGVTIRWVGGEFGNLDTYQGGAMGEAWSDFAASHFLVADGYQSRPIVASYVSGNHEAGLRNFALDRVLVNFGDLGWSLASVHFDGEIWSGALWDIREALEGAKKDGADYAMQLIADALPGSGPIPSMLNVRDAILAADQARTKGKFQDALWEVFARHGMGPSAFSDGAGDVQPKPGFDHPDGNRNGVLTGKVFDASTGKPIEGARIIIGEFEARVTPMATTGKKGAFRIVVQGGRYPLAISARGYGYRRPTLNLPAGVFLNGSFGLDPNLASSAAGGKIVESSNPSALGLPELAIDDLEGTTWRTDPDESADGEFFVVDLAGKRPVEVRTVQISSLLAVLGSPFDTLGEFQVLASTNGKRFKKILTGTFGGRRPQPLASDVNYRRFELKRPVKASFLKLVGSPKVDYGPGDVPIRSQQGGGLQMAELQAFGAGDVTVKPPESGKEEPFHGEGIVLVPTPSRSGVFTTPTLHFMQAACLYPPPTQGVDAYVFELPDSFGDSRHVFEVQSVGLGPNPLPDADVLFLSADCVTVGRERTASEHESGTIPQGTKYALVHLWSSTASAVTLDASSPPG